MKADILKEYGMKRRIRRVCGIVMAAFLFSGCAAGDKEVLEKAVSFDGPQYEWGKESDGATLVLWSAEPEMERIYMKRAIQNYEEATGGRIQLVQFSQSEFQAKVEEAFSGKTGAPDLLLSYGGTNIDSYHPDENFYDFSDALWVEDLTDTSINQTIYHGRVIGLPHWEASVSGFLYNKDIFNKYHITVPESQEEFMKVCETLRENGIIPMYIPFQSVSMLLYQFPLDSVVKDTDTLNALNSGEIQYSDLPEMERIVSWYKSMADNQYFGEDFLHNDWIGMDEAMKSGKYAMMPCWDTWLYTDYTGDAGKIGLMPAFMGVPENGSFEGPNLGLMIVNRHSERLAAALDFITFLADPFNYNRAFDGIYTAPVFKHQTDSISTPQYIQAQKLIDSKFYDSTAWLRIKGFSQMDASAIIDYITANGDVTAEQCLEEMDRLRTERLMSE